MFDSSQPFPVKIFSGVERVESLRYPTDEELIDRSKRLRSVRRNLGRGRAQWDTVNNEAVNADLFEKLRSANGDAAHYDAAEAAKFVDKLLEWDLVSSRRDGDQFEIELAVTSRRHKVKHVLRMPTQRQMADFSKATYRSTDTKGGLEMRVLVEPSGRLWENLHVSTEGYANGHVPISHKQHAISEAIELIAQLDEGDDDPEA
jgi:hypothetical protein